MKTSLAPRLLALLLSVALTLPNPAFALRGEEPVEAPTRSGLEEALVAPSPSPSTAGLEELQKAVPLDQIQVLPQGTNPDFTQAPFVFVSLVGGVASRWQKSIIGTSRQKEFEATDPSTGQATILSKVLVPLENVPGFPPGTQLPVGWLPISGALALNGTAIAVVGYQKELVMDRFRQLDTQQRVSYVEQTNLDGTGGAAWRALAVGNLRRLPEKPGIIAAGDQPLLDAHVFEEILNALQTADLVVGTSVVDDPKDKGRIIHDQTGRILNIEEQKDIDEAIKTNKPFRPEYQAAGYTDWRAVDAEKTVNTGVYGVRVGLMEELLKGTLNNNAQKQYYATSMVTEAVKQGKVVVGVEIPAWKMPDVTRIGDLPVVINTLQTRAQELKFTAGLEEVREVIAALEALAKEFETVEKDLRLKELRVQPIFFSRGLREMVKNLREGNRTDALSHVREWSTRFATGETMPRFFSEFLQERIEARHQGELKTIDEYFRRTEALREQFPDLLRRIEALPKKLPMQPEVVEEIQRGVERMAAGERAGWAWVRLAESFATDPSQLTLPPESRRYIDTWEELVPGTAPLLVLRALYDIVSDLRQGNRVTPNRIRFALAGTDRFLAFVPKDDLARAAYLWGVGSLFRAADAATVDTALSTIRASGQELTSVTNRNPEFYFKLAREAMKGAAGLEEALRSEGAAPFRQQPLLSRRDFFWAALGAVAAGSWSCSITQDTLAARLLFTEGLIKELNERARKASRRKPFPRYAVPTLGALFETKAILELWGEFDRQWRDLLPPLGQTATSSQAEELLALHRRFFEQIRDWIGLDQSFPYSQDNFHTLMLEKLVEYLAPRGAGWNGLSFSLALMPDGQQPLVSYWFPETIFEVIEVSESEVETLQGERRVYPEATIRYYSDKEVKLTGFSRGGTLFIVQNAVGRESKGWKEEVIQRLGRDFSDTVTAAQEQDFWKVAPFSKDPRNVYFLAAKKLLGMLSIEEEGYRQGLLRRVRDHEGQHLADFQDPVIATLEDRLHASPDPVDADVLLERRARANELRGATGYRLLEMLVTLVYAPSLGDEDRLSETYKVVIKAEKDLWGAVVRAIVDDKDPLKHYGIELRPMETRIELRYQVIGQIYQLADPQHPERPRRLLEALKPSLDTAGLEEGVQVGQEVLEEVRFYGGFTERATGTYAGDTLVQEELVQSGQRRAVVPLPAATDLGINRVFVHPDLPKKDFAGVEEIQLPGDPTQARVFLMEYELRETDLILLPLTVAVGSEDSWRPSDSRTPIVVISAAGLEEGSSQILAALALIARNLEGQVLRIGLEEWTQRVVGDKHLSLQY